MFATTQASTDAAPHAWSDKADPGCMWIGVAGVSSMSITLAEAQQLIVGMQKELAYAEAAARGVAA